MGYLCEAYPYELVTNHGVLVDWSRFFWDLVSTAGGLDLTFTDVVEIWDAADPFNWYPNDAPPGPMPFPWVPPPPPPWPNLPPDRIHLGGDAVLDAAELAVFEDIMVYNGVDSGIYPP